MLRHFFCFLFVAIIGLASSFEANAAKKTSIQGCQMSRKGTKIRCPSGMYIRQDVVERKIASEKKSGVKQKPNAKKRSR